MDVLADSRASTDLSDVSGDVPARVGHLPPLAAAQPLGFLQPSAGGQGAFISLISLIFLIFPHFPSFSSFVSFSPFSSFFYYK